MGLYKGSARLFYRVYEGLYPPLLKIEQGHGGILLCIERR